MQRNIPTPARDHAARASSSRSSAASIGSNADTMATNWVRIRRAASAAVYAAITKTRRRVAKRYGHGIKLMWICRSTVAQQQ
eukprot:10088464-Heterocapsa_arctica.AAC.1